MSDLREQIERNSRKVAAWPEAERARYTAWLKANIAPFPPLRWGSDA